ncbi:glutathionylspermidine synthase family protein [Paenibacillus hexagrammi]|uniref:Glutathionylspermidine synthase family protein n=1 Tax=Paenibacillus hexagrammi TaxID=2908839 RepID=A0ABY3SMI8_9BACL|nr:glutathionylspermidine synthase family protein [Paenibacillus sp. YPD9-1]UJF34693.1 glutathionylspermidine synthase family protein [Paenibacillus sp. YPD9-1]
MIFEVIGTPHPDRERRVSQLSELGFKWADIDGEAYWVDQLVVMDAAVCEELHQAASMLWMVFDKAARFVIGRRDLYEALSIPEVLWDGLDGLEPGQPGCLSRYARFDFTVQHSGEIKLLELNADTPTGYVEAAVVTPWMCEQYDVDTSNIHMKDLIRAAWEVEQPDFAACIGYGTHVEDSGTIEALVAHSGRKMTCVDCLDLWIDEGVVHAGEDHTIKRMFALYPKEWMGVDDGGEALAYSLEEGYLHLVNSLHAVILQSKGLQAVIWGLHELRADLFSEEEHNAIRAYMLPTYTMPVWEGEYVSKSMFGREGGSVELYDAGGQIEHKDEDGFDTSVFFQRVYQQRADLPVVKLAEGERHLLTGLFMLNGTPCGLLGRAGGIITGNTSHFVAIGVGRA